MFQEKNTTAKMCARIFEKKQQQNPKKWAENIVESIKDLTNENEQLLFLQFLANPTGNPGKKITTATPELFFEDDNRFKLLSSKPGHLPSKHFLYKPKF